MANNHFTWMLGGMIAVYLSQWLRKKADQFVGRRDGTFWSCRHPDCKTSCAGPVLVVQVARNLHYETYPLHHTPFDEKEDLS